MAIAGRSPRRHAFGGSGKAKHRRCRGADSLATQSRERCTARRDMLNAGTKLKRSCRPELTSPEPAAKGHP